MKKRMTLASLEASLFTLAAEQASLTVQLMRVKELLDVNKVVAALVACAQHDPGQQCWFIDQSALMNHPDGKAALDRLPLSSRSFFQPSLTLLEQIQGLEKRLARRSKGRKK